MPILIVFLNCISLKAKNIIWERDILPLIWHLTLENQLKSAKYHIQISFLIILTSRISSSSPFISCHTVTGYKSHLFDRLRVRKPRFLEPSSPWKPILVIFFNTKYHNFFLAVVYTLVPKPYHRLLSLFKSIRWLLRIYEPYLMMKTPQEVRFWAKFI